MKKLILALVLVGIIATSAFANSFFIRNSTGSTFFFIYVSDNRSSDWGDDLLGNQVLSPGEILRVEALIPMNSTTWDIRIIDDDGDTYTLMQRRITEGGTVAITYNDLD